LLAARAILLFLLDLPASADSNGFPPPGARAIARRTGFIDNGAEPIHLPRDDRFVFDRATTYALSSPSGLRSGRNLLVCRVLSKTR
jgi:hypothetical protein